MNSSYIEVTNPLNGPIILEEVIHNKNNNVLVGLREITFTADWYNVSKELGNNDFMMRIDDTEFNYKIIGGNYNIELLEKAINNVIPGFKLDYNFASGSIEITLPTKYGTAYNFMKLSHILGCESDWLIGGKHVCKSPHKLYSHKALFVYLDKINTTKNILANNGRGSKSELLQKIPVNDIQFGESTTIYFENPQFRKLCNGDINEFSISILDANNKKININSCFVTLEIKEM